MRANNKQILLIILFFMFLTNVKGQFNELKLDTVRNDTLRVYYLGNFNYDVLIIYINGVEMSSNILYSKLELSSCRVSDLFYINQNDSTIKMDIILYERNHRFSKEYNALWYEWSVESDSGLYYKPIKNSYEITLAEDGYTRVSISAYPKYETDKRKAILLE